MIFVFLSNELININQQMKKMRQTFIFNAFHNYFNHLCFVSQPPTLSTSISSRAIVIQFPLIVSNPNSIQANLEDDNNSSISTAIKDSTTLFPKGLLIGDNFF